MCVTLFVMMLEISVGYFVCDDVGDKCRHPPSVPPLHAQNAETNTIQPL